MSLDDITDYVDVDTEVLVHQDVAKAPDLRPRDLRVHAGDLIGKMVHGLADELEIALDRILGHLRDVSLAVQRSNILPASLNCLKRISDALRRTATHSGTASASAETETGRLSS